MLAYNRSEKYESTERMIDNITSIFSFSRDEEMSYLSVFSFLHGRRNEPYVLNGDLFGNLLLYLSLHVNMITRSFDHLYCMHAGVNVAEVYTYIHLSLQPLDTASARMQTRSFGNSQGLCETLKTGDWTRAFDGLGASLILVSNPAVNVYKFDSFVKSYFSHSEISKTSRCSLLFP